MLRECLKLNVLLLMFTFIGCAQPGSRPIDIITKQVEEDRLVPATAIQKSTILDSYHHLLPYPDIKPVSLVLDIDKPVADKSGDDLVLQIGLSTKKPQELSKKFHFLFMRPSKKIKKTNETLDRLYSELSNSSLTNINWSADWSHSPISDSVSLLKHNESAQIDDFLRRYLVSLDGYKSRHFVVIYAADDSIDQGRKQKAIDMARYLDSKGTSLSVIAVGDKPDFGFLKELSNSANGTIAIHVDKFKIENWFNRERDYVNANKITEIEIDLHLGKLVDSVVAINGSKVQSNSKNFTFKISDIRQGEQRVRLYRIKIPKIEVNDNLEIATVNLRAFDTESSRYYSDNKKIKIKLSNDKNLILRSKNSKVIRSQAILETPEIIAKAARNVSNKRPYLAMRNIYTHRAKLEELSKRLNDDELLYDSEVLASYESRLYEFADEFFQSIKSWNDLVRDSDRFEYKEN